ncbi:hypothetical protein UPYG_G00302780 [Umbra pygmaea]|uniref:Protein FAM111A n=1 Tax=Umbra pygmaea TaxID=75934 RepID=A0ABD0W6N1_UMBPY
MPVQQYFTFGNYTILNWTTQNKVSSASNQHKTPSTSSEANTKTSQNNMSDNQPGTSNQSKVSKVKTSPENIKSDNQPGKSNQSQASKVKKVLHDESHTFQYLFGSKNVSYAVYSVTCCYDGTVLDALQTSDVFRKVMTKYHEKEVVIQRQKDLAAVCTDFPCHLIDVNEVLKVRFINGFGHGSSSDVKGQNVKSNERELPRDKLITFCIETTGGKNITTQVIKNPELRRKVKYVCVYAYKGEKVKFALRRDGRFDETIFKTECVLSDPKGVNTEMSQPVDGLCGKTVQVERIGLDPPPQLDSEEDCDNVQTEEQCETSDVKPEPASPAQNSTTPNTGNTEVQGKEAEKGRSTVEIKQKRQEIPKTKEILEILRSQFAGLFKVLEDREKLTKCSDVQRFFREEFGKKTKGFQEVIIMRSLIKHGDSVCQVRYEGEPKGTGFLLFDKFILTNAHVIKPVYDKINNRLQQPVTVAFDYEDRTEGKNWLVKESVVVYEKGIDMLGCYLDFALLELSPGHDINLPPGLLRKFSFPTTEGGICLIGHPEGGVKKIDLCFIITYEDRPEAINRHLNENQKFVHVINERYFEEEWDIDSCLQSDTGRITYDTCFFGGSSGSPVFNEHCQVVAMHTGGYAYKGIKEKTQSIIEYAIPLYSILKNIIIEAVIKKRVDVLEGFLEQTVNNDKLSIVLDRVQEQSKNASIVDAFKENLPSNSNTSATGQEQQRTFYQILFDRAMRHVQVTGDEPMEEGSSDSLNNGSA